VAQDRQVLDCAQEHGWINNKILRKVFSKDFGGELYSGSYEQYFDEVFGKDQWKTSSLDAHQNKVITFGFDPYPFVVFLGVELDHFEIRVLAKIDGKFYERPLNINIHTAESQIEIAVLLTMTNAQREYDESIQAETQASH
jgi:hypothetical protein